MTDNYKDIYRILYFYVNYILRCEKIIKDEYSLTDHPYLNKKRIPKKGEVIFNGGFLEYNFHGSGCSFLFENIDIDYDIYIDRSNYIVTSPWKFKKFIDSFSRNVIDERDVEQWLEILKDNGVVEKVFTDYSIFEISFEWYSNYNPAPSAG